NHDSSVLISSKIDSLFDEFAGELTLLKSFPPRIDKTDCHPEKEIRLTLSLLNEDFSKKIFSNPLFKEEIISIKKNQHHFNVESDLVESMFNRDSSIISSSSKIDSLLDEFAGELTLLKSISPRIDKNDCHPENEIHLSQRLLYDNSSPRPDSFMEEIDLFLTPDDPMLPSVEDDEDSEGDILFLERLLHDDPIPLPDTLEFSYEVRIFLPFFTYPRLLYDNSSPRPPEEFVSENSNDKIESFSPSHIPNKDNDSIMEEIDLTLTPDDPMPPSIEEDDDDSRDTLIRKELFDNYSLSIPENESFHFDIPSFSRPPAKPPDGNTGILNIKMTGDVSDQKIPIPELTIILEDDDDSRDILIREELLDNYSLSIPENESFYFDIPSFSHPPAKPPDGNTRILNIKMTGDVSDQKVPIPELTITLVSNQEKSPDLLSHRGFEIFQPSAECPMKIHGKNIPTLDVPRFHFYPP
nr:hypothetical protein [Tanacetum cinerariifolium]